MIGGAAEASAAARTNARIELSSVCEEDLPSGMEKRSGSVLSA
jgi:hypothetical protein